MSTRDDDTTLEEALAYLGGRVEEHNREVEQSLENIYGDLEDHEEQIVELANFTRENRDSIDDNFDNINQLWFEIDDIYDEIEDVDGRDTSYNIDFTGIENTAKYIGGGIKNFFGWGREKTEDFDPDRRKVLAGLAGAAVIDYTNIVPGDEPAGDGILRLGDCGRDSDAFGLYGEQRPCSANVDNGNGTPDPTAYDISSGEVYSWDEFNQCLSEEQITNIEDSLGDPESFEYEAQVDGELYDTNIIEDDEVIGYLDNEGLECEVRR